VKGHLKGFTLIELLVVIAIIGILSAVVLASLSTARSKGKDASVQESMSGMRAAAEIYYSNTGNSYGTQTAGASCTTGVFGDSSSNMAGLVTAVQSSATAANTECGANGSAWFFAAKLPSGSGNFCVDSTGAAKSSTTTFDGTNTWDATGFKCR
jgi:prepilin-type N-terminal cleavage/methylation domain-containing protein